MPGRLFIGNLSFNVADADLSSLCTSLNLKTESVRIMRDKDTGRSRGFAFVDLAPESDLAAAISELNGKVLDGRALTVNEARPQKKREFQGGMGGAPSFERRRDHFDSRRRDSDRRGQERPKRKVQELY